MVDEMSMDLLEAQGRLMQEFKEDYCKTKRCPKGTSCWQIYCNPSRCSTWASCPLKGTPQCRTYDLFMSRNAPKYKYHYDIKTKVIHKRG